MGQWENRLTVRFLRFLCDAHCCGSSISIPPGRNCAYIRRKHLLMPASPIKWCIAWLIIGYSWTNSLIDNRWWSLCQLKKHLCSPSNNDQQDTEYSRRLLEYPECIKWLPDGSLVNKRARCEISERLNNRKHEKRVKNMRCETVLMKDQPGSWQHFTTITY